MEPRPHRSLATAQWCLGKYNALRALISMAACFDNWSEVWRCYRSGVELPAFQFRNGLVLRHRPEDQPLLQFYEVFRDHNYRRYISEHERGVMVDIGANVGFVTLDWTARLHKIRVHAYEPHPATFAMLRDNVDRNRPALNVKLYQEAVANRAGTITLQAGPLSMETSAYRSSAPVGELHEFSVPAVGLNQVVERCQADGPVVLIKIDAEGAESDILEGARPETLKKVLQFVIEYHDFVCANARARCERTLTGSGFRCVAGPATVDQGLLYAWQEA